MLRTVTRNLALCTALTSIGLLVSGCGGPASTAIKDTIGNALPSQIDCLPDPKLSIFMAKPLCGVYKIGKNQVPTSLTALDPNSTTDGQLFISAALAESYNNCQNFINTFTTGQSAENTAFDVLSVTLSALATAFVPANTVRALAGAATISQGAKGAINSDLYQQLTIQLFVQAINATYFADYNNFLSNLSNKQQIPYPEQFNKIQLFHRECSIPFAAEQIASTQAKVTPASPTTTPITAADLTKNATFKGALTGSTYTITNVTTTGTPPNTKTTYTYKVTLSAGASLPPQQVTSSDALVGLLNADHATSVKSSNSSD
jgi:hypothetical protein